MAGNVGVTAAAMLADELEERARDGHLPTIGGAGDDLRAALEAAKATIHAMLPSLAAQA